MCICIDNNMSNQVCYDCIRKTECYTSDGLFKLKQGVTFADMHNGYECGACFRNYEEAREFIYVIGDVLNSLDVIMRQYIFRCIAEKYNLPVYNIELEFDR